MNRRTLKKHCKRAMHVLVQEHGFSYKDFLPARGDETIDAPHGMEKRFVYRGFMTPLKGTWLYHYQSNYECNEWDCKTPLDELREL